MSTSLNSTRAAPWKVAAALTVLYIAWGTTYFAIRVGVATVPPFLFGGTRICLAGFVLMAGLLVCGQSLRISGRDLLWMWCFSLLLFVGGNGLLNVAEKSVNSGLASVLTATTPLWLALLEMAWPRGERLTFRGWIGVLAGLLGVVFLALPKFGRSAEAHHELWGYVIALVSSISWAVGSSALRHRRTGVTPMVAAAYQMVLGGASMTLLGVALGEPQRITAASLTADAIWAYLYLLVVGSLIGYVAFVWLLGHVSTTVVGTYSYVNPVVALLLGLKMGEDNLNWPVVTGMLVILAGVALVRSGGTIHTAKSAKPLQKEASDPHFSEPRPLGSGESSTAAAAPLRSRL